MLKKETVNLRFENANLCLNFGIFHTHKPLFRREPFSLNTVTRFLRGEREKCCGPQGPRPLLCNL